MYRTITRVGVSVLLALTFLGGVVYAQSSFTQIVSFQGRLGATDGKPLPDGPYSVRFAVYNVSAGGLMVWNETQSVTQVGGTFTAYLGSVTGFPPTLFYYGDLWLGIKVGADPEMAQRFRFTPSPWAIRSLGSDSAQNADKVDTFHAAAAATANYLLTLNGSAQWPLGTIPQGSGSGLDSDKVDTFHAGATPAANRLLTLDGTSKWPIATIPQGTGSTLDADKVDTFHAAATALANTLLTLNGSAQWPLSTIPQGSGSTLDADKVDTFHAGATPAANRLLTLDGTSKWPITTIPQGAGSTLDADKVDTFHASATPTANYLLPLDGTGKFPTSAIAPDTDWTISGSNIYRASGNVGIGVTAPTYPLTVTATGGIAVYAEGAYGLYGLSTTSSGHGVHGSNNTANSDAPGVYGEHAVTDYYGIGVQGVGGYKGVEGLVYPTGGSSYFGTLGSVSGGSGSNKGLYGYASGTGTNIGVYGYASGGTSYGGYFGSNGGPALFASANGSGRENAALVVHNTQAAAGMGMYLTSVGTWATTHMENSGTGEVLWLARSNSDGPFIVCNNTLSGGRVFQVNADGYTYVTTLEITGGSDLSEQFRITSRTGKPEPGMVVCIDPDSAGDLMVSGKAYDRTVAGIISGAGGVKPGMRMGQKDTIADGDHPVALTGRVWCWCDASSGAIEPGDMLTTSDVAGHAMKVTDHALSQGSTIGKAMTSLKSGRGLVLVLVGLQ